MLFWHANLFGGYMGECNAWCNTLRVFFLFYLSKVLHQILYVSVAVKVKNRRVWRGGHFSNSFEYYVFFVNTEICRSPTDHREVKHKGHENLCYLWDLRSPKRKWKSRLVVISFWKVNYQKSSKLWSDIRRKEISFL